ncbi:MAG TPA: GNAT family N-acetyltransferase [Gemmatimonadales bacterium]|nr:GNAT family N-acetyltransferase [Gemmatimonadales bacterium]
MIEQDTRSRAVTSGDVPGVLRLFEQVFGHPISERHYRWKLQTRPSPVHNAVIALDQLNQPVFHIAGIPCRCWLGGAERWVMVAVDAMTRPDHRRQGLLTTCAAELFESWKAAGVTLVLGLPNENWRSRTHALGWQRLAKLGSWVLPLRPERLLGRRTGASWVGRMHPLGDLWRAIIRKRAPGRAGITVRPVETADERFDILWRNARTRITHSLARDRSWIEWRYLQAPSARYEILIAMRGATPAGFGIYGERGPHAAVVPEIFAPEDPAAFSALVEALIALALERGRDSIRGFAAVGSPSDRQWRRMGLFRGRHAFGIEYVPLEPGLTRDFVLPIGKWEIAGGDFDFV